MPELWGAMTDTLRLRLGANEFPVCDFCSAEQVVKDYDCVDYLIPVTNPKGQTIELGSTGKWAACVQCAKLIDENNREGLLQRATTTFCANHGISMEIGEGLLGFIQELQEKFWKGRRG
jgi:hypothetical protein